MLYALWLSNRFNTETHQTLTKIDINLSFNQNVSKKCFHLQYIGSIVLRKKVPEVQILSCSTNSYTIHLILLLLF